MTPHRDKNLGGGGYMVYIHNSLLIATITSALYGVHLVYALAIYTCISIGIFWMMHMTYTLAFSK